MGSLDPRLGVTVELDLEEEVGHVGDLVVDGKSIPAPHGAIKPVLYPRKLKTIPFFMYKHFYNMT